MAGKLNAVTGATGLLGSHIAEQLIQRGERVRALVRPGANVTFLRSLGVELIEGDLTDPASLLPFAEGAAVVYHSAAKVGDWGPWRQFQSQVIEATGNLLQACEKAGVGRFLHVSSVTVYGHPRPATRIVTEDEPLGQNLRIWDYYCRAKIAAEERVRAYPGHWTIVRPSWIYGPRDRNTLPRLVQTLEAGRVMVMGRGDNPLNVVYASDVADGALRAASSDQAIGQAYNLTSEGEVTQRELLDLLTDALGRRRVRWRVPYRVAYFGGFLAEVIGRLICLRRPPRITRYVVGLISRPTTFSTAKAARELGWKRQVDIREGLRRSLEWWRRVSVQAPQT